MASDIIQVTCGVAVEGVMQPWDPPPSADLLPISIPFG